MAARGFVAWTTVGQRSDPLVSRAGSHADGAPAAGDACRVIALSPMLTPSAVVQPLVTDAAVLVYEGRIDNRAEIARAVADALVADADDGVAILAAYEKWGLDCASKLVGEFCFALFDRRAGVLLAATDAVGVRPLLCLQHGSRCYVASSLEALFEAAPRPSITAGGLAAFIATGGFIGPTRRTLFDGVEYLGGGATLVQTVQGVRTHYTWAPDLSVSRQSAAASDEEFRALLFDGVGASLRAPGPVAMELSGGLDSSSVVCAALALRDARAGVPELLAYSFFGSKTTSADERVFQQMVQSRFALEHHLFDLDALDGTPALDDCVQPPGVAIQAWVQVAQRQLASNRGVRVCLTGQGGDAVFCLARGDSSGPLARAIGRLLGRRPANAVPSAPRWLTPILRREVGAVVHALAASPGRRLTHLAAIKQLAAILPPPHLLAWEARYPLLYRPLVEFMLRLPWSEKATSGQNRIIQRRALEGVVLPPRIAQRTTKGDFTPRLFSELRENWHFWEPLTSGARLGELGIVEPALFREACLRLRHGLAEGDLSFFNGALLLEAWLRAEERRTTRI